MVSDFRFSIDIEIIEGFGRGFEFQTNKWFKVELLFIKGK